MTLRGSLLAGALGAAALAAVPVASATYLSITGLGAHPYFAAAGLWTRATAWTLYAPQAGTNWWAAITVGLSGFLGLAPLLLAGTAAASIPRLLSLRAVGQWVPPISGVVLVTTGLLTLVANVS